MATLPLSEKVAQSSQKGGDHNKTEAIYGAGVTQRGLYGTSAKRDTWNIKWILLDVTDRNTLWDFYKSVGTVVPFQWQAPSDGVIKEWWFKEPITEKQHKGDRFTLTVSLRQYNTRQVPVRILDIKDIT